VNKKIRKNMRKKAGFIQKFYTGLHSITRYTVMQYQKILYKPAINNCISL
jgi:hypothetical protein